MGTTVSLLQSDSNLQSHKTALSHSIKKLEDTLDTLTSDEYTCLKKLKIQVAEVKNEKGNIRQCQILVDQLRDVKMSKIRVMETIRKLNYLKLQLVEQQSYNHIKKTLVEISGAIDHSIGNKDLEEIDKSIANVDKVKIQREETESFMDPAFKQNHKVPGETDQVMEQIKKELGVQGELFDKLVTM